MHSVILKAKSKYIELDSLHKSIRIAIDFLSVIRYQVMSSSEISQKSQGKYPTTLKCQNLYKSFTKSATLYIVYT